MNPRLRSKREDGTNYPDWEEKKLGEVLTQRRDIQTISEKAPLLAFTIEDGVIDPKDKKTNKRDFLIKDKENKKFQLTKYDDIIYNPANIKFGAIHHNKFGEGVVSPIYVILKTNQNPNFVEYSLKRESFISKTKKYLEGTVEKLRTLKPENFLSLSIFFPCLEEQEKIGSFLSDIDEVILATSQEIKKLEELKKGVIQKIFSQEVRFKKADGTNYPDWEEKKLGEVTEDIRGGFGFPINEQGKKVGDLPFYKVSDMNHFDNQIYMNFAENYINFDISKKLKCNPAPKDTIIFPKLGMAIKTNKKRILSKTSCYDNNIFGLIVNDKYILPKFLYYKFVNLDLMLLAEMGNTIPSIRKSALEDFVFSFPCLEEQQKIADCLSAFDEAISLSKQELDKWKLLKKGFLQQMFV